VGESKIDTLLNQHIQRKADQAKVALTKDREVKTQFVVDGKTIEIPLTQEDFESMAAPLLKRLENPIRRALKDSKLKAADLDEIVMVGGATRMPLVRKLATQLFQRFPAIEIDPDKVVAVGSAIQAGLKARDEALNDTVMTDVCPYSLGTDVAQGEGDQIQAGFFLPIIERNCFIPISKEQVLYTAHDNQTAIEVNVYQGENAMVKDNVYLGSLTVKVPKRKRSEESVGVRFTYDINGLLEVEVVVHSTKSKHSITIEKNPGLMTDAEIKERLKVLAKLKVHPRDQLPNQTLISRAERVYQEALGDKRSYVSHVLAQFMAILDRQDDREIREARKELESILDEIENEPVF
jgi:molecular chaperone HscC